MKMKKLSFLLFLTPQMGMAQAQEKLVALSFGDGPNTTTTVHMKNFNFYAPTQVVFGRNTETQVAELVKIYEMAR